MSGTGTLFYLMGASGAGKDSLLAYARRELTGNQQIKFAQRYITRPPGADGDEEHRPLSVIDYELCLNRGIFAMHWSANGLHYGISNEIDDWLQQNKSVIVNGSRQYLRHAQIAYPNLHAIIVKVKPEILRERLLARKRESPEMIEKRLLRAKEYDLAIESVSKVSIIENNSTIASAGKKFTTLIKNSIELSKKR